VKAVDAVVRLCVEAQPFATVVEVGACLSTRFTRVVGGAAPYITVDEPAIAGLRRELFDGDQARLVQLSAALEQPGWAREVFGRGRTAVVVMEDLLSALVPEDAFALVENVGRFLARGSSIVVSVGPAGSVVFDDSARCLCLMSRHTGQAVRFPSLRRRSCGSSPEVAAFEVC
jgi:O-methyltransferase involved in polyketide biosynthesis